MQIVGRSQHSCAHAQEGDSHCPSLFEYVGVFLSKYVAFEWKKQHFSINVCDVTGKVFSKHEFLYSLKTVKGTKFVSSWFLREGLLLLYLA